MNTMLKSIFLDAQTYASSGQNETLTPSEESMSAAQSSTGSNNTLYEQAPALLDTECFLFLGLLFCKDRDNHKAKVFYSLLRSGCQGR